MSFSPVDAPELEVPIPLVCGVCAAPGRYRVGTVLLDLWPNAARETDDLATLVSFTRYFRCRKCDGGGPWNLTPESVHIIKNLGARLTSGDANVPLLPAKQVTFDGKAYQYPTQAEDHIKELIEREPRRAFLWMRLANVYRNSGLRDRAETTYRRALDFDPVDVEVHGMLAQALIEGNRPMDAVPHWQAVLQHARNAHHVDLRLRKRMVRAAIHHLLEARAQEQGEIELLPRNDSPDAWDTPDTPNQDESVTLEVRAYDLSCERDFSDLCDSFLEAPRAHDRRRPRRRKRRTRRC